MEECGELVQICGKKLAYFHTDTHPDGGPGLAERMEQEIADVFAAASFVVSAFGLDAGKINERAMMKLDRFKAWDRDKAA